MNPTNRDFARYAASLLGELAKLAVRYRLKELALVLDMAHLQAGLDGGE